METQPRPNLTAAIRPRCGDDRAAAAYELALLLHGLGRHREGDAWLRRLGFRHRLADAAFRLPAAGSQVGGRDPPGPSVPAINPPERHRSR